LQFGTIGRMEYWNDGILGFKSGYNSAILIIPSFHYSNTPLKKIRVIPANIRSALYDQKINCWVLKTGGLSTDKPPVKGGQNEAL